MSFDFRMIIDWVFFVLDFTLNSRMGESFCNRINDIKKEI